MLFEARKIGVHSIDHPTFNVDVDSLMRGEVGPSNLSEFILKRWGKVPLVFSSSQPTRLRPSSRNTVATNWRYAWTNVSLIPPDLF